MKPFFRLCLYLALTTTALAQNPGRRPYQARCTGCHGDDGTGGGHGPGIVGLAQPRATSQSAIRDIILKGLPGAGMPAFQIPPNEADLIAAYVLTLKSSGKRELAPGDPAAGQRFFAGKGNCASCHTAGGRGGVLGPDLTTIGRDRNLAQIRQALLDPQSTRKTLTVRLRTGETLRGIAKNESAFDLQLLATDGKLHLLLKEQISDLAPEKSLMPKLEATPSETRDLLAYLTRLGVDPSLTPKLSGEVSLTAGIPFTDVARPKPGSWPTYHGSESGNRYSPLDQINTTNIDRLAPNWMFTVGAPRGGGEAKAGVPSWIGLEVTPVVVDGVMYVTSVNEAYALDARSGREIWHYSRPRSQGLAGDAASGINRGVAVLGDGVFMVTDNAHLIALHRLTGQLLWDVTMADSSQNYGSTSAPLAVNDLIIAGVSGGDEGIRGFLDAYRASTGEHVWRFWTVPAPGEPGSETWVGRAIEHGCAATWLTGTFDPESNTLYWPTGNPCPDYNGGERKGDNLYSSSILALDPATGKLRWYYQFSPHDMHDWDATETPTLIDATFRGQPRKLLVQANRNGFFYVLDRLTGRFLMAEPFVKLLTWASRIGPDGRPQLVPGYEPTVEGARVCPSVGGAANWQSTAFHPGTGLYYVMAQESCNIYSKSDEWWEAGQSFYGGGTRRSPTDKGGKFLRALELQTGKLAWERQEVGPGSTGSGVMATAGGLVFYGDSSGAFVAVDAKTGAPLWHFNTGQPWKAGPMTYVVDGKQYVAVAAGGNIISFRLPE